jgi:hypothetical protein
MDLTRVSAIRSALNRIATLIEFTGLTSFSIESAPPLAIYLLSGSYSRIKDILRIQSILLLSQRI